MNSEKEKRIMTLLIAILEATVSEYTEFDFRKSEYFLTRAIRNLKDAKDALP